MKNYRTFLTPQNETWQHAIERYIAFSEADMKEYFPEKDSYQFANNRAYQMHSEAKMAKADLDKFEELHKVRVPDSLTRLLCDHGAFMIGNELFEIFHGEKDILTFVQVMEMYNYHAIVKAMRIGMLQSMNQYYFFFGVTFPQTDETSFLYFNKAGHFGKMYIDGTDHNLVIKKIFPAMFNGTIDKYSLDTLMSNQLDRVIINALTVKGYID